MGTADKVVPFSRDNWLAEHYDELAQCIEDGVSDCAAIARRLSRPNTNATEVHGAIGLAKRNHWPPSTHKCKGKDLVIVLMNEAESRRQSGRKPISSYTVQAPPNSNGNTEIASPHLTVAASSALSDEADSIRITIQGDTSREEIDRTKPVFLYLMKFVAGELLTFTLGWAKIGISNCPPRRAIDLATGVPADVTILDQIEIPRQYDPYQIESLVHELYPGRLRRELFAHADIDVFRLKFVEACKRYEKGDA